MSGSIQKHLSLSYLEARQLKSHTARRQLKLEVVKQFWELSKSQKAEAVQRAASVTEPTHPPELDPDPCDIPNINGSRIIGTRGIVVRTHLDSSDEKAWEAFSLALEGLERDSIANITDTQAEIESESESGTEDEEDAEAPGAQKETAQSTDANDDAEMEEASSSSVPAPFTYEADAIFTIVDPMKPGVTAGLKDRLSAASNIALLRIFNDASIVPVPKLPTDGSRRVKPGHRLIDEDGYQEAYTGARLWVWDQQSAKDQTLRLISPQVFVYGDAIGDSWRARTAHMWDLQLNLDAGMRIDFSGGNLQPSQSFKYRGISLFASRAVKDYGPDVHLVAATSGNAGVALAWVCEALKIQTSVFIPTTATTVQPELEMAGARVVVGGTDYADAFLEAQRFCETTPKAVLMSSYDHPTLWEGHSTMVFELGHQLPKGTTPDAIVCNVGGGGLLGGILQGVNVLGWGHSKIIGVETHGSNCYQLSMLANSAESGLDSEFPKDVTFAKLPPLTKAIAQGVYLAKLPAITSKASSLGARCPSQTTVEMGLARRAQAMQDPAKYGGLSSVSVPDEIAMDAVLSFLDEQKLLAELACGATLSLAYTPGLLSTLVPKSLPHRPVVVFIICGGSKTAVEDLEQYCSILRKLGTSGLNASRKDILINLGVGPT